MCSRLLDNKDNQNFHIVVKTKFAFLTCKWITILVALLDAHILFRVLVCISLAFCVYTLTGYNMSIPYINLLIRVSKSVKPRVEWLLFISVNKEDLRGICRGQHFSVLYQDTNVLLVQTNKVGQV